MKSLPSWIQDLQKMCERGNYAQVSLHLRRLNRVPRRYVAAVSEVARRIGEPSRAITLLRRHFQPEEDRVIASELELLTYGASLVKLGALSEAENILNRVDPAKNPRALLYRVHIMIALWRYGECIPLLEQYLRLEQEPNLRVAGILNLAASLAQESSRKEALEQLQLAESLAQEHGLRIFEGNIWELRADLNIQSDETEKAIECILMAKKIFRKSNLTELLFLRKWEYLIEGRRCGNYQGLENLLVEAQRAGKWESVRHIEKLLAVETSDKNRFLKLYFGTPLEAFRKYLFRHIRVIIETPSSYIYSNSMEVEKVYHLEEFDGSIAGNLLRVLASDFYRPFSVSAIHEKLYPGEYFNPQSSRHRVHQSVLFLRKSLVRAPGLHIECKSDGYRLVLSNRVGLRIGRQTESKKVDPAHLLQSEFGVVSFAMKDCIAVLNCSRRTGARVLESLINQGQLERFGAGPGTQYSFKSSEKEENAA